MKKKLISNGVMVGNPLEGLDLDKISDKQKMSLKTIIDKGSAGAKLSIIELQNLSHIRKVAASPQPVKRTMMQITESVRRTMESM